jgi:hypothetical protein
MVSCFRKTAHAIVQSHILINNMMEVFESTEYCR